MRWFLLLFIVVPLVELYLLLALGSVLGFWPTVAIVMVTGSVGALLAKHEGLRVFRSYQEAISQGKLPDEGILGGVLVLVGGVLLITPGVLTDVVGMLLLVPQTRKLVADRVRKTIEHKLDKGVVRVVSLGDAFGPVRADAGWQRQGPRGDVVDTEGVEVQSTLLLDEPEETRRSSH